MRAASALRASALEVRLRLSGLGVIDAGIDLVECLALLDDRALPEKPTEDNAGDLRPDLRGLECSDAARQILHYRGAALLDHDIADRDGPLGTAASTSAGDARFIGTVAAGGEQERGPRRRFGAAKSYSSPRRGPSRLRGKCKGWRVCELTLNGGR